MKQSLKPLKKEIQKLLYEQDGSQVLEVVIMIAILLGLALVFNEQLQAFANRLFAQVFSNESVFEILN